MRKLLVIIYLLIAYWFYLQEVPLIPALLWPLLLLFIASFIMLRGG